jgi:hypothetical protein
MAARRSRAAKRGDAGVGVSQDQTNARKLLLGVPWPVQTTHDQLINPRSNLARWVHIERPQGSPLNNDAHIGNKVMTGTTLDRRVLLTPAQKAEAAELRTMGFTRYQAWRRVLTLEQRQVFYEQIRARAARLRYIENPYREMIKRARNSRNSACRRGAKYNAWQFTITEDDLDWPTYCPVLPWIELHYPGRYRNDPAGASLDRIDHQKGYVPGNVRVISLRANLLRKDITPEELRALADFFFA